MEHALGVSSKAVASLARELRRTHVAAAAGQVRELHRALDAAQAMASDVVARVGAAVTTCDVDEVDMLASGAYAKELLAAADVAMFAEDDRLLCYSSIAAAWAVPGLHPRRVRPRSVPARPER